MMRHLSWAKKKRDVPSVLPMRVPRPLTETQYWDQWRYQPQRVQVQPGYKIANNPGMVNAIGSQAHLVYQPSTDANGNPSTQTFLVINPVGVN